MMNKGFLWMHQRKRQTIFQQFRLSTIKTNAKRTGSDVKDIVRFKRIKAKVGVHNTVVFSLALTNITSFFSRSVEILLSLKDCGLCIAFHRVQIHYRQEEKEICGYTCYYIGKGEIQFLKLQKQAGVTYSFRDEWNSFFFSACLITSLLKREKRISTCNTS